MMSTFIRLYNSRFRFNVRILYFCFYEMNLHANIIPLLYPFTRYINTYNKAIDRIRTFIEGKSYNFHPFILQKIIRSRVNQTLGRLLILYKHDEHSSVKYIKERVSRVKHMIFCFLHYYQNKGSTTMELFCCLQFSLQVSYWAVKEHNKQRANEQESNNWNLQNTLY